MKSIAFLFSLTTLTTTINVKATPISTVADSTNCTSQLTQPMRLRIKNHLLRNPETELYSVLWVHENGDLETIDNLNHRDAIIKISSLPRERWINLKDHIKSYETLFQNLEGKFKNLLEPLGYEVWGRVKTTKSLRQKLFDRSRVAQRNGVKFNLNQVFDIIGFQIAVPTGDSYNSLNTHLNNFLDRLNLNIKDVIDFDIKGFGNKDFYKTTHLVVMIKGVPIELQLMTLLTHRWAAYDHKLVYKSKLKGHLKDQLTKYSHSIARLINQIEYSTPKDFTVTGFIESEYNLLIENKLPEELSLLNPNNDYIRANWLFPILKALNYYEQSQIQKLPVLKTTICDGQSCAKH